MADRRLQVFHAVAKQKSFTRAAELLFMTQPAVTFQIKQLEEHLNTRLFDRLRNHITLTPAGELVLFYAEKMLSLSAEMEARVAEMTDEVSGPLMIGASLTIAEYLLPPILGAFKQAYPGVAPQLVVGNSEVIEARVQEHFLDIGLIESPAHQQNIECEVCCEDELRVICATTHPLAQFEAVRPEQLSAFDYVSREQGSGTREFTNHYLKQQGIDPDVLNKVMALGSPEAIKSVVGTGIGFAIMSEATVTKELAWGTLCAVPFMPRLTRELSMIYPREKFRSRLLNTFIEFSKQRLQGTGPERLGTA